MRLTAAGALKELSALETGSKAYFEAARSLYRRHGFEECAPFGEYKHDPNSVFMAVELDGPRNRDHPAG